MSCCCNRHLLFLAPQLVVQDVLNCINAALYTNQFVGQKIVGREEQMQQLRGFLNESKYKNPGCVIISGTPGTGKSLTTRLVVDELLVQYKSEKARGKGIPDVVEVKPRDCVMRI